MTMKHINIKNNKRKSIAMTDKSEQKKPNKYATDDVSLKKNK